MDTAFRFRISALLGAILMAAPLFVQAVTVNELQARVAELQAQIAAMTSVEVISMSPRLTALYSGSAPVSVAFSAYSLGYVPAKGRMLGILFGDGGLETVYQRPECTTTVCTTPDLFKVHTYWTSSTFTAKLVEFSGCPTNSSMSGECFGQTPKIHAILDVIEIVVQ